MSQPQYYLEAEDPAPGQTRAYPIEDWPCVVGRGSDCQLQLDFDRISRRHARFEQLDSGLKVTDLGSTNGTFVNHERIESATEIQDGDSIHFADHAFCLRHREPSGQTRINPGQQESSGGTDTVIGFTAAPTGFPVQAPEFFETLNDELVCATLQVMTSGRGTVLANALRGRSTHPRLGADSTTLIRLAEELGEELRLAQLIRRRALQQADQANLQTDLFLAIHPGECEEPEVLIEDLQSQHQNLRHLALVCELPFDALDPKTHAHDLPARLRQFGLEICATGLSPHDDPEALRNSVDHVLVSALIGPEQVQAFIERWQEFANVVVDDIEDPALVEHFARVGAGLLRGPAIGPERDIDA